MTATVRVGIDASAPSRAALAWAAAYAADCHLPLVLNHAVDDADIADSDQRREGLAAAERLLQDAREQVATQFDGLDVTAQALVGDPARALADEADPDDLLVIGTHKTGFLRGRMFGARSLEIVARARSAVAVVPADHRSSRSGVVVAITRTGQEALEWGLTYGVQRHQPFTLVSRANPDDSATPPELATALTRGRELAPRASIRSQSTVRELAEAVLDAGRSALVTVLPEASFPGNLSDALTHDVLMNITGPVVIVRNTSTEGHHP